MATSEEQTLNEECQIHALAIGTATVGTSMILMRSVCRNDHREWPGLDIWS